MFRVINKQTRPNENVNFFMPSNDPTLTNEFKKHMLDTYLTTGKLISFEHTINGLELIATLMWDSEASFEQWKNDPVVVGEFFAAEEAYITANNIVSENISKETI